MYLILEVIMIFWWYGVYCSPNTIDPNAPWGVVYNFHSQLLTLQLLLNLSYSIFRGSQTYLK